MSTDGNQDKNKQRKRPPAKDVAGTADLMCSMERTPPPVVPVGFDPFREAAIVENLYKWVIGTVIHYYIMPSADATKAQKDVVRWAFKQWKDIGIGLDFAEVTKESEAEIRILFDFASGRSSSYIGTYCLNVAAPNPTMRFGWDLQTAWGKATAIHEIGHALGLKHEHQNPKAGIVWDEPKVLKRYHETQGWSEAEIRHNILNKLNPADITNTDWDVTSVMHYPIEAGLIVQPPKYQKEATPRNLTISPSDRRLMLQVYPKVAAIQESLEPMMLRRLELEPSAQADLAVKVEDSRDYEIQTVGKSDARLVLFERRGGEWRYMAADDDSVEDRNARLSVRLVRDREYKLSVRLHFAYGGNGFGVMLL